MQRQPEEKEMAPRPRTPKDYFRWISIRSTLNHHRNSPYVAEMKHKGKVFSGEIHLPPQQAKFSSYGRDKKNALGVQNKIRPVFGKPAWTHFNNSGN